MNTPFVEYLKSRGVSLFEGGGTYWRLDGRGILSPAPAAPCYVELSDAEAKALLKQTGAHLLYYSAEWWYIICDRFDPRELSSKARNQINRGKRSCYMLC